MSNTTIFLIVTGLVLAMTIWWFAVRIVFGKRIGEFEPLVVGLVALVIPVLLADLPSAVGWRNQAGGEVAGDLVREFRDPADIRLVVDRAD